MEDKKTVKNKRFTEKRNRVYAIPLKHECLGKDLPKWDICRHSALESYLYGDAVNRLAELENKIENGTLVEIPEGAVVLTREEWARLRNLEINYNDAYENYLSENAKLNKRVQELEDGTARVVNEIKAFVYNNDGLIEKINNIAKRYGVEEE